MTTIGSLFSGIGGLELGLEWAGLGPVRWQVEIDPFCRRVLAKHWPNAERFEDVTRLRAYPAVDLICGGFPCQDVSSAGKRKGLAGQRSGLWFEYARIVSEVRPRFVVVENVASGAKKWLPQVRRDLCALGYGTRAFALSAADVGAPHLRRRIFVVGRLARAAADAHRVRGHTRVQSRQTDGTQGRQEPEACAPAHADGAELRNESGGGAGPRGRHAPVAQHAGWRTAQPDVVRVVHGLSRGVDSARRRALGNAVVPQCAEVIGRIVREWIERGAIA